MYIYYLFMTMHDVLYSLEVLWYIRSYKGSLKQNLSIDGHDTRNKMNFHVDFCNALYFRKVWLIWRSNGITECQKV